MRAGGDWHIRLTRAVIAVALGIILSRNGKEIIIPLRISVLSAEEMHHRRLFPASQHIGISAPQEVTHALVKRHVADPEGKISEVLSRPFTPGQIPNAIAGYQLKVTGSEEELVNGLSSCPFSPAFARSCTSSARKSTTRFSSRVSGILLPNSPGRRRDRGRIRRGLLERSLGLQPGFD